MFQLRLGDDVDDYCIKCKRLTNHSILSLVDGEPAALGGRALDLLFVLARVLNRANLDGLGGDDVYWRSERLARQGADDGSATATD